MAKADEARAAGVRAAQVLLAGYPHLTTPERLRGDGTLEDIAFDLGVVVEVGELHGATGRLLRVGGRGVIRVQPCAEPGRRAFTIAHELGHFVLNHGDGQVVALCSEIDAPGARSSADEAAANAFAAELLMPAPMITAIAGGRAPDLHLAEQIATRFQTSIVASARRLVELAAIPCAVVYAEAGRVAWSRRSRTFPGFIPTGRRVPEITGASPRSGTHVRRVPAASWDRRSSGSTELIEQSIRVPDTDATLTMLLAPDNRVS